MLSLKGKYQQWNNWHTLREKSLVIRLGTYSSSQYDSVTKCENPNSDTQPQTQLGTSRITTNSRRLTQVTAKILETQQGQVRVLTTHKNHSSVQTPHRSHNSSSMSTHNGHSPAQLASKSHSSSPNNPKSQGSWYALTNSRRVTS